MPKGDFMHGSVECIAAKPHGLFTADQPAEMEVATAVLRLLRESVS